MERYIWQRSEWPQFTWDTGTLLSPLAECRLLQGKLLGKLETLGLNLDPQAQAEILVEETLQTAAIENEQLDVRSVRSSVARRLGLPSAGMPVDRRIDDLVSVLIDAGSFRADRQGEDPLRGPACHSHGQGNGAVPEMVCREQGKA